MAENPREHIFQPIADLLQTYTSVPSFFGKKHLAGGAPPRYVWVPISADARGPRSIGGTPRNIRDLWLTFAVHCWAAKSTAPASATDRDFDLAWTLVANLLSAAQNKRPGNHEVGAIEALDDEWVKTGAGLIVPLSFRIPIEEHTLDRPTLVKVTVESVAIDGTQITPPPDGGTPLVPVPGSL